MSKPNKQADKGYSKQTVYFGLDQSQVVIKQAEGGDGKDPVINVLAVSPNIIRHHLYIIWDEAERLGVPHGNNLFNIRWGLEPENVKLDRAERGILPFLEGHWASTPIGIIQDYDLSAEGLRFSFRLNMDSERAAMINNEILKGFRPSVSIGAKMLNTERDEALDETDSHGNTIYGLRITEWEPVECSSVPIPADPAAAINQKLADEPQQTQQDKEPKIVYNPFQQSTTEQQTMSDKPNKQPTPETKDFNLEGVIEQCQSAKLTGDQQAEVIKLANRQHNTDEAGGHTAKIIEFQQSNFDAERDQWTKKATEKAEQADKNPEAQIDDEGSLNKKEVRQMASMELACDVIKLARAEDPEYKLDGVEAEVVQEYTKNQKARGATPRGAFIPNGALALMAARWRKRMGGATKDDYGMIELADSGVLTRQAASTAGGNPGMIPTGTLASYYQPTLQVGTISQRLQIPRISLVHDQEIGRGNSLFNMTLSDGDTKPLTVADSQQRGDKIALKMKTGAVKIPLTRKLLQQGEPDIVMLTLMENIENMNTTFDGYIFTGTGTAPQSKGILAYDHTAASNPINRVVLAQGSDDSPSFDNTRAIQKSINKAKNAATGFVAYVVNGDMFSNMEGTKKFATSGGDETLLKIPNDLSMSELPYRMGMCNGFMVFQWLGLDAGEAVFGNFKQVLIADFNPGIELRRSTNTEDDGGETLRMFKDQDHVIRWPQAFCKIVNHS